MGTQRMERVFVMVAAVAFGLWGVDLLPGWILTPLLVVGGVLLLVDFARWLDRKAY